jgi:hypothetical protein
LYTGCKEWRRNPGRGAAMAVLRQHLHGLCLCTQQQHNRLLLF